MASIRKRGNSYNIRVSLGYYPDGRKRSASMTWKPEKKMSEKKELDEAKRVAVLFEEKIKSGCIPMKPYTLDKYVDEVWKDKAKKELKPLTYDRYMKMLRRILPGLGWMKLENIQPPQIRALMDDIAEDKREDLKYTPKAKAIEIATNCNKTRLSQVTGVSATTILNISKGARVSEKSAVKFAKAHDIPVTQMFDRNEEFLSATTILHHFRVLSTIMTSAMQDGLIHDNPLRRVKPPKVGRLKISYLDDIETKRLMYIIRQKAPHPFDMIIILLLQTGMRRGECCGLTWKDIDFRNNIINIDKTVLYLPSKGVFEETPKNESSVRVIKVGYRLMEELQRYKQWQDELAAKVIDSGKEWENTGRVFTSNTGGNINPGTVTSWFHHFIIENDLPPVSIHGLRHTHASLMIAQGMPITTTAHRLGHSSPTTTANIYAHPIAIADAKAAVFIDDFFYEDDNK